MYAPFTTRTTVLSLLVLGFFLSGAPQRVRAEENQSAPQAPFDYVLLVDASHSMLLDPDGGSSPRPSDSRPERYAFYDGGDIVVNPPDPSTLTGGLLERVKQFAKQIIESAADGTSIAIYAFNDGIVDRFETELTPATRKQALDRLEAIRTSGKGTAIYDSVWQALERIDHLWKTYPEHKRAGIFLFTDGDENRSTLTFDEILARFRLLRSETDHYLYWRYYTPKQGGRAAQKPSTASELARLAKTGVIFHDTRDLAQSLSVETASVTSSPLTFGEELRKGPVSRIIEFEMPPNGRTFLPVQIAGTVAAPGFEEVPLIIEPPSATLEFKDGKAHLAVQISLPADLPPETARKALSGKLRLTTPEPAILQPATLPVAIAPNAFPYWKLLLAAFLIISGAGPLVFWLRRRSRNGVLVVTRDEELLDALGGALRNTRLRILPAPDARTAKDALQRKTPKIIVVGGDISAEIFEETLRAVAPATGPFDLLIVGESLECSSVPASARVTRLPDSVDAPLLRQALFLAFAAGKDAA